ncbi:MAG: flagellar protein FlaG [Lachnospiraceae bacterium]|mgnify:CR=1 FL=1|jgi:flagellar protein FlaG|nr:flagellar protein FlaG [Lachnospiraceae bacterium]
MNIEPVNSAMTFQASAQKPTEKQAAVDTDVTAVKVETQKPVDATTLVVKNASETDGQEDQNESLMEQQAQSQENIKKMVEEFNKKMGNSEAIFGIHEGTNRIMIKIVDKESKEVLKEFPPEKTLDMITMVWEMAGILIDEKG